MFAGISPAWEHCTPLPPSEAPSRLYWVTTVCCCLWWREAGRVTLGKAKTPSCSGGQRKQMLARRLGSRNWVWVKVEVQQGLVRGSEKKEGKRTFQGVIFTSNLPSSSKSMFR